MCTFCIPSSLISDALGLNVISLIKRGFIHIQKYVLWLAKCIMIDGEQKGCWKANYTHAAFISVHFYYLVNEIDRFREAKRSLIEYIFRHGKQKNWILAEQTKIIKRNL